MGHFSQAESSPIRYREGWRDQARVETQYEDGIGHYAVRPASVFALGRVKAIDLPVQETWEDEGHVTAGETTDEVEGAVRELSCSGKEQEGDGQEH